MGTPETKGLHQKHWGHGSSPERAPLSAIGVKRWSAGGVQNEARTLLWWEAKTLSHWRRGSKAIEEKIPYFQGTSRSQTHLTVGEGQYTLLLSRQRSMASGKGAEKKPSVLWRGRKPNGPRTHANTKPSSATPGGRTKSSLSPQTIHRPRLRVSPHWEEEKGTMGVLPPGTGPWDLSNTEDRPWKHRTPIVPTK